MLLPPRGGVSRLPGLAVASLVILLSAHNVHTQDCNLAEAAIDLIFVVDASGAQGQRVGGLEEWNEHIRFFIKRVADLFTITGLGTHVSVVTYANNGTVNVALNDAAISRADLYNNIDTRVNYRGGDSTNLMNGLQVTNKDVFDVTWGKRREYREFIVILTYSPLWYPEIVDEPNNQDYRFTALELLRISANNLFASIQDGATGDWAIVKVGLLTEPDVTDTLTNGNTSRIYSVSTLSDLSQAVPPLALRICNMLERVVCPSTLDIGLLIDTSDSIRANGDQWPYIQQFLKSFIEQLDIGVDGVHVGAISYSTQAIQVWKLNEYFNKADLSAAIDQFPIQDANTNTAGGLEALDRLFTIENGDRVNVPNVGIVFTDGTSNVRAEDVSSAALVLRQRDIRMISVGITQNVNRAELAVIASDLSMVVLVLTHSELTSRLDRVTQAACEDAVVAPPLACPAKVDILFILDSSSSITYQDSENWSKRVIGFAKAIVGLFDIGEDKARVAAIRFSTDANVEFYLNTDYTKEGIYNRLDAIVNNGGQTNMADAMQLATEEVLTEQNGWRFRNNDNDPPTLVFFITDGQANVNTDRTGLEADRLNDASFLMNVFAIGITDEVNIFELNAVARERENIFLTLNFNRLYQLINDIITKVCTTPVGPTTTTTTTPAPTTTPTPTSTPSQTPVPFSTTTGTTGPPMTTPRFTPPTTSTPEPVETTTTTTTETTTSAPSTTTKRPPTPSTVRPSPSPITPSPSPITPSPSPLTPSTSPTTPSPSPITPSPSSITPSSSTITPSPSPIIPSPSPLTPSTSPLTPSTSPITPSPSPITPSPSPITPSPSTIAPSPSPITPSSPGPITPSPSPMTPSPSPITPSPSTIAPSPSPITPSPGPITPPTPGPITPSTGPITPSSPTTTTSPGPITPSPSPITPSPSPITPSPSPIIPSPSTIAPSPSPITPSTGPITPSPSPITPSPSTIAPSPSPITPSPSPITPSPSPITPSPTPITPSPSTIAPSPSPITPSPSPTTPTGPITPSSGPITPSPAPSPPPSPAPPPASSTTSAPGSTTTTRGSDISKCDGRADVVFLIDASGSIEQRNFDLILMFIDSIVNLFNIDNGQIRVGVETYADDYKLEFNLNTYLTKATVQAAVKNIVYTRGVTNTPAALRYLRTSMLTQAAGARDGVTKVAVILTDGESSNRSATIEEAKAAKQAGIHLISLGIGDWLDMHELYAMASYPTTKNMIQVKNFNQLTQVTELIRDAVCDNIDECATNTCNGGTCSNEIGYFWCSCPDGPNTGPNCDTVCTDRQKDVVFVVDASTSVGLENFRLQLDFVTSVVQNLAVDYPSDSGTRVGMVTFADAPREDISLSDQQTRRQLLEDINVMYSLGRTDTAIALRHACSQMFNQDGDRPRADNILVLLTDGKSNNRTATFIEAAACRRKGVTILVVGIGDGVSTIELEGIASDPTSSNIFPAESFTALELLNSQFTQALCNNQDECASNPCQNGGICRNNINGYVCDCPGDWEGKHCDRQCSNRADIIFVLDASGSIRQERFPIIKDFVESIMREFHVGPTKTQFGVAYFSDNAFVQHHLNTYNTNIQDNVLSMKLTPFLTGRTHSKSALDLVRSSMFTTANGDRGSATNIAIFITDGNSNIQAEETLKAAAEARLAGIHIMVIPVGLDFSNMVEISGMVSAPVEQNILFVQEFSELQTIVTNLTLATCEDYDECVSSPCQNGGTCRNMLHMYRCDCPPEFTGVNCQIGCSGSQMDLAIILDLSGSTAQQYQLATEFADELIMGLDMNQDRVRVAVVTYNETAKIEFYLNEHLSDKFSVQNAMRLPHRGGKTNAQAAFNLVHTQIFTESNGDRNGVKDILVFVSDGYSNIEAEQTVPQAMEAKAKDIEIYSVAIGTQPHFTELNEIASQPLSTHIFRLINRAEIMDSVLKLVEALCQ